MCAPVAVLLAPCACCCALFQKGTKPLPGSGKPFKHEPNWTLNIEKDEAHSKERQRVEEAARKALAAEEKRKEEAARKALLAREADEKHKEEAARKALLAREAEEKRREEAARKAQLALEEEQRRREETALKAKLEKEERERKQREAEEARIKEKLRLEEEARLAAIRQEQQRIAFMKHQAELAAQLLQNKKANLKGYRGSPNGWGPTDATPYYCHEWKEDTEKSEKKGWLSFSR